jgi:hypothetical protein
MSPETTAQLRTQRTPEELAKARDAVRHEHAAFEQQYKLFIRRRPEFTKVNGLQNALYEATMVHLRALCDFFCPPRNTQNTDIIATDFPGGQTSVLPDVLERAREVANKQIVHLTYDRNVLTPDGQRLPWKEVRGELTRLKEKFERDTAYDPVLVFAKRPRVRATANVASTKASNCYQPEVRLKREKS